MVRELVLNKRSKFTEVYRRKTLKGEIMKTKIQFKYLVKTLDGDKPVTRTFSKVNADATEEELLLFKEALAFLVKEENYLYKIVQEEIS